MEVGKKYKSRYFKETCECTFITPNGNAVIFWNNGCDSIELKNNFDQYIEILPEPVKYSFWYNTYSGGSLGGVFLSLENSVEYTHKFRLDVKGRIRIDYEDDKPVHVEIVS